MRQSSETDIACIDRMLRYVKAISDAYVMFNITSAADLKNNYVCQLAITQAITNVHEVQKRIRPQTIEKMPRLDEQRLMLKAARNIASHDYESLDFGIIDRLVKHLISPIIRTELEVTRDDLRHNSSNDN